MVGSLLRFLFHAVKFLLVLIDTLDIFRHIAFYLLRQLLAGVISHCFQQIPDSKRSQDAAVDQLNRMRHLCVLPSILEIVVAFVPGSGQRQTFAPCRIFRHQLADFLYRVLILRSFDDDLVMDMGDNVQSMY